MINWASDVATQEVTGSGREPVEASRVALDVRGGAVVVQWSLSYHAFVQVRGGPGRRFPLVQVQPMAALERDGVEIARWTLGEDQARGAKDPMVRLAAHRDGERPVRRSDAGLRAQDLRPEGVE